LEGPIADGSFGLVFNFQFLRHVGIITKLGFLNLQSGKKSWEETQQQFPGAILLVTFLGW